eukprot:1159807-Pelagomonas_calceolata.AAC.2
MKLRLSKNRRKALQGSLSLRFCCVCDLLASPQNASSPKTLQEMPALCSGPLTLEPSQWAIKLRHELLSHLQPAIKFTCVHGHELWSQLQQAIKLRCMHGHEQQTSALCVAVFEVVEQARGSCQAM